MNTAPETIRRTRPHSLSCWCPTLHWYALRGCHPQCLVRMYVLPSAGSLFVIEPVPRGPSQSGVFPEHSGPGVRPQGSRGIASSDFIFSAIGNVVEWEIRAVTAHREGTEADAAE